MNKREGRERQSDFCERDSNEKRSYLQTLEHERIGSEEHRSCGSHSVMSSLLETSVPTFKRKSWQLSEYSFSDIHRIWSDYLCVILRKLLN
jgi:hypothetical protein